MRKKLVHIQAVATHSYNLKKKYLRRKVSRKVG